MLYTIICTISNNSCHICDVLPTIWLCSVKVDMAVVSKITNQDEFQSQHLPEHFGKQVVSSIRHLVQLLHSANRRRSRTIRMCKSGLSRYRWYQPCQLVNFPCCFSLKLVYVPPFTHFVQDLRGWKARASTGHNTGRSLSSIAEFGVCGWWKVSHRSTIINVLKLGQMLYRSSYTYVT